MPRCKRLYPNFVDRLPWDDQKGAPTADRVTCACDYDHSDDELKFLRAIDKYIQTTHRPFPTWSEVLKVVKSLGYHK